VGGPSCWRRAESVGFGGMGVLRRAVGIWSEHAPSNPTGAPQFRGEFDEWEMTALEMALQLVPDLETAIDRALMQGMSLEVVVKVKEEK
jgi:hypothetical protein